MNERDSETIAGMLEELGFEKLGSDGRSDTKLRNTSDILVINTCSIRENADNKFFGILGQVKKFKESNPEKIVAVCGCMMQQQSIVDTIKSKYNWVDIVFGTHNIDEFPRLISNVIAEKEKSYSVLDESLEIVEGLPAKREYSFKAYVNIMYGCNNFCTYCIVPYTRGREKSRAPQDILDEIRSVCAEGAKEITLLGQNVNSYRGSGSLLNSEFLPQNTTNPPQSTVDFPDLLEMISEVEGLERIRFMTSHPKDLSDKLIKLYSTCEKLCPSIHLPIQSGSTEILRRMNRKYSKEDYLLLIEKLRVALPEIVITTDFIVGFPGETEEDFLETLDVIRKVEFDSAFTFLYSPRNGTPASEYEEQIPEEVKHERFNRMVELLNSITLKKNLEYLGRVETVLIEGWSKTRRDFLTGRTAGGKLVNIKATPDSNKATATDSKKATAPDASLIGTIHNIRITDVNTFSFLGEVIY